MFLTAAPTSLQAHNQWWRGHHQLSLPHQHGRNQTQPLVGNQGFFLRPHLTQEAEKPTG